MLINDNGKNLMGKKDIVFDNEQKKSLLNNKSIILM